MKKKVIITGCNGFIGKRLVKFYNLKGYIVYGLGRKIEASTDYKNVTFYSCDLESEDTVNLYKSISPDIFIHCAGNANVGVSVEYPELDFERNVGILYKTLSSIKRANIKPRFIFLSSAAVYGNPQILPISENQLNDPISPYGLHKKMCEDLCKYFRNNYDMDILVVRIFSAYGNGLKKQILWDMYNKYLRYGCIELFGTGYETRDFIHIDDVVQALNLIEETSSSDYIYNVANGEEISIGHLAEEFAKCLGLGKEKIKFNGKVKAGDPINWRADITKLKELGYCKSISLQDGLKNYIDWVRKIVR